MVHCGIIVKAGTRDEQMANNGVAHFIEHAVFKGTSKRKPFQLFNLIESVGGEINAYTTRENTVFYTSSLKKYFGRNLDLLSDLVFNATFLEKELEKEKKVVLEEIEMYLDSPEDSLYDEYFFELFKDHALGYNILGTPDSLNGLNKKGIEQFIDQYYTTDNLVLSICGNVSLNRAKDLAEKFFSPYNLSTNSIKRESPSSLQKFNIRTEKDFYQSHSILGAPAYSRKHDNRFAMMVLNNVLGGNSMNSRLNLNIREKHGYVYHISSSYTAFDDVGVFFVTYGCDETNLDRTMKLVNKEFNLLKTKKLGANQLNAAKRQLQGQLAMAAENPSFTMLTTAKSLLNYDRIFTLDEVFASIDAVTAENLLDVANEVLDADKLSSLTYLSKK